MANHRLIHPALARLQSCMLFALWKVRLYCQRLTLGKTTLVSSASKSFVRMYSWLPRERFPLTTNRKQPHFLPSRLVLIGRDEMLSSASCM